MINPIKYSVLSTLHVCRGKKTSLPKPSSHPRLAAGPVSYTHLDVYKRQVLICGAELTPNAQQRIETLKAIALKLNGIEY